MQENEMLTADEVAHIMRVHIKTVRKWVQSGELPSVPIGSREYRIMRSDLNAFIEKRKRRGKKASDEERK